MPRKDHLREPTTRNASHAGRPRSKSCSNAPQAGISTSATLDRNALLLPHRVKATGSLSTKIYDSVSLPKGSAKVPTALFPDIRPQNVSSPIESRRARLLKVKGSSDEPAKTDTKTPLLITAPPMTDTNLIPTFRLHHEPALSDRADSLDSSQIIETQSTVSEETEDLQSCTSEPENKDLDIDKTMKRILNKPVEVFESDPVGRPRKRPLATLVDDNIVSSSPDFDNMRQRLHQFEAIDMLKRLLDLRFFKSAKSDLERVGLILRLMQCKDLERETISSNRKATAAPFSLSTPSETANGRTEAESGLLQLPVGRPRRSSAPEPDKPIFDLRNIRLGKTDTLDEDIPRFNAKLEKVCFLELSEILPLRKLEPYSTKKDLIKSTADVMKDALVRKLTWREYSQKSAGKIYIYWVVGNFGHVKIGVSVNPTARLKGWKSACKHQPRLIYPIGDLVDEEPVPHVYRVEALIHAELRHCRKVELDCLCPKI